MDVSYLGYVEVKMWIPGIRSFEQGFFHACESHNYSLSSMGTISGGQSDN